MKGSTEDANCEVRLKHLTSSAILLEQSGKFIMIQGEEISDKAENKPVHMNATNLSELFNRLVPLSRGDAKQFALGA